MVVETTQAVDATYAGLEHSRIMLALVFAALSLIALAIAIQLRRIRKLEDDQHNLNTEQARLLEQIRNAQDAIKLAQDAMNKLNGASINAVPYKKTVPPATTLPKQITCPKCRKTSFHPDDIRNRYCGHCHWWTSDPDLRKINPDDLAKKLRVDPPLSRRVPAHLQKRADEAAKLARVRKRGQKY